MVYENGYKNLNGFTKMGRKSIADEFKEDKTHVLNLVI